MTLKDKMNKISLQKKYYPIIDLFDYNNLLLSLSNENQCQQRSYTLFMYKLNKIENICKLVEVLDMT